MVTHEGFDFPDDLYYTDDLIWLKKENGNVRIGMATFGVDLAGKIKFVRLRPPGKAIAAGRSIGTMESGKWTGPVKAPVGGTITEVNEELKDNPGLLNEDPYGIPPDLLDVKVVLHGTEIVTLAKKNYQKYEKIVERIKYYTEFGVEFKVCATSAYEYGYKPEDFHDFVQIVPNAITEIIHWQMQGYGLVIPRVTEKHFSVEELR